MPRICVITSYPSTFMFFNFPKTPEVWKIVCHISFRCLIPYMCLYNVTYDLYKLSGGLQLGNYCEFRFKSRTAYGLYATVDGVYGSSRLI